jgi:hypothetical protein
MLSSVVELFHADNTNRYGETNGGIFTIFRCEQAKQLQPESKSTRRVTRYVNRSRVPIGRFVWIWRPTTITTPWLTPPYVLEPKLHFQRPHAFGYRQSLKSPYRIRISLSYQIDDEEFLLQSLCLGLPWAGIAQPLQWLVSDWINRNPLPTGLWTYFFVTIRVWSCRPLVSYQVGPGDCATGIWISSLSFKQGKNSW